MFWFLPASQESIVQLRVLRSTGANAGILSQHNDTNLTTKRTFHTGLAADFRSSEVRQIDRSAVGPTRARCESTRASHKFRTSGATNSKPFKAGFTLSSVSIVHSIA